MFATPLSTAGFKHHTFTIQSIASLQHQDPIAQRLEELGFLPGESLRVIAHTLFSKGPMVIKIGFARFALRQSEAARILVIVS